MAIFHSFLPEQIERTNPQLPGQLKLKIIFKVFELYVPNGSDAEIEFIPKFFFKKLEFGPRRFMALGL